MIDSQILHKLLESRGTDFFTGVPDSLLKSFCSLLTACVDSRNHIIAVNEGAACALAAGYHLATGKVPLVYMQNSGIGNAVNPLLSLTDGDVYRIPTVLLVGWRGEPDVKDEPQHVKQGKVTCELFDTMGVPYLILADNEDELCLQLDQCYEHINSAGTPFALVVRKDTFAPYTQKTAENDTSESCTSNNIDGADIDADLMSREEAVEVVIEASSSDDIFISTTGMASRELYELRDKHGMGHERDFLTVGSMGHASSLALSVALQKPDRTVVCVDGDGAALMHMGAMAAIGARKPVNLRHIVMNNRAHDSVGGQPTIAGQIDLAGVAMACGYGRAYAVNSAGELRLALNDVNRQINTDANGPVFIEVSVRKGNRKELGRPKSTPIENKKAFMRFIAKEKSWPIAPQQKEPTAAFHTADGQSAGRYF